MKNISSKKGFTLIELLIVIAIIGILAAALLVSLGGARQSARDARRVSDLRNVQAALELYFNKSAGYPMGDNTSTSNWSTLSNGLTGAGVGINRVPNDPISGRNYKYASYNGEQQYILGATLENESAQIPVSACPSIFNGLCTCVASGKDYCVGI